MTHLVGQGLYSSQYGTYLNLNLNFSEPRKGKMFIVPRFRAPEGLDPTLNIILSQAGDLQVLQVGEGRG